MYLLAIIVISSILDNIHEKTYTKQHTRKNKTDEIYPNYIKCKKCSEHLKVCSKITEPYFKIYLSLWRKEIPWVI